MLQATVEGFGGSVGGAGVVEVGQNVGSASGQGAAQAGDLLDPGWHAGGDLADQAAYQAFALGGVGVAVGADHLLVDRPGHLHGRMALVSEQRVEALSLMHGDQAEPGQ